MSIEGRYKILKILGDGSFGAVYLAESRVNGEQVCLSI
jgi:serine/threonine protein kinase